MKTHSKFLSLVLRHCPEEIGLKLDKAGWVRVDELVKATQSRFHDFTFERLDAIVAQNDKRRFEYDVTGELIRACQGHSVPVELGLETSEPPFTLYHGTAEANIPSIIKTGLNKGKRHAVHLSEDDIVAKKVGGRHGKPVVLAVTARLMHFDGFKFSRSTNGVWLTDHVPARYLTPVLKNPM